MDVKVTVIVRVLSLILVFMNQWLSNKEVSPIPVDIVNTNDYRSRINHDVER